MSYGSITAEAHVRVLSQPAFVESRTLMQLHALRRRHVELAARVGKAARNLVHHGLGLA